jgi:polysaccharide export outer membrane protein
MARTSALILRLCVIATAIVMLILSVRAVWAQGSIPQMRGIQTAADAGPVYGYNPGQGLPRDAAPAQQAPANPQPLASSAPQPTPSAYGYRPGEGLAGPDSRNMDSQSAAPRLNADYRLGPGDKVRVTVYGEADLSGDYQIDGTGIVRLPLIGALRASGYTAPALEAGIGMALAKGYLKNPRVNVEIVSYRPFYIIGAVNRPGEYPYVDHISALNAVALAGGFTDTARQSTVYVRHEGSAVEEEVTTDQVSELRPGDTIRIRTTWFWQAMQIFTPLTPAMYAAAAIH